MEAILARQALSKGEPALGMALLYREPEKGGQGHEGKAPETSGFTRLRLQARAVLVLPQDGAGGAPAR